MCTFHATRKFLLNNEICFVFVTDVTVTVTDVTSVVILFSYQNSLNDKPADSIFRYVMPSPRALNNKVFFFQPMLALLTAYIIICGNKINDLKLTFIIRYNLICSGQLVRDSTLFCSINNALESKVLKSDNFYINNVIRFLQKNKTSTSSLFGLKLFKNFIGYSGVSYALPSAKIYRLYFDFWDASVKPKYKFKLLRS